MSECVKCKAAIDACAEEVAHRLDMGFEDIMSGRLRLDLHDEETPSMLAYDRQLLCGGHTCEWDGEE